MEGNDHDPASLRIFRRCDFHEVGQGIGSVPLRNLSEELSGDKPVQRFPQGRLQAKAQRRRKFVHELPIVAEHWRFAIIHCRGQVRQCSRPETQNCLSRFLDAYFDPFARFRSGSGKRGWILVDADPKRNRFASVTWLLRLEKVKEAEDH